MQSMSVENLIIYILLWTGTVIVFYRQRKSIDASVFLSITFLIYAVFSLLYYLTPDNYFSRKEITLLPLLYLFGMILLTMCPLLSFNIRNVKNIPDPNYLVLDVIAIIFIVCAIVKFPADIIRIKTGLTRILLETGGGSEIYENTMSASRLDKSGYGIRNIYSIYINIFWEIVMLIGFFNLWRKRRKKLTYLIFISLILVPFGYIAISQRGPALSVLIMLIGTYFLFAPVLGEKIKKLAKKIGVAIGICAIIPVAAITISRFGVTGSSSSTSLFYYIGQENLYFDVYAFDNNGLRNGDRVIPLFKKMAGERHVPDTFWERRIKYPLLKINDEVFVGYIGDFLLDFGPIVSTLIFAIMSVFFWIKTRIKKGQFHFKQLLILQFLLALGLEGGMKLFPFADSNGLTLIAFVLTYLALYLPSWKRMQTLQTSIKE